MQDRQYTISPRKIKGAGTGLPDWLLVFAIIIFCGGFIAGIGLGEQFGGYDFSWALAFLAWLFAAIEGSLLLALREILIVMRTHQAQKYTITPSTAEASAAESANIETQQPSEPNAAVQSEAPANS